MGRRDDWSYYEPSRPRPVRDGIKAKSRRGDIGETWWSKRWIHALESLGMGSRLSRGRSYARRGQVVSIDIQGGKVVAKVQGSRPRPYTVEIALRPLSEKEWDKVADAMASQAIFAAKLLSGEMPRDIEDAFKEARVPLFPSSARDLSTSCSCPDWANPCKHVAAVYYLLAERFDEDPFLIFALRGKTKEEIVEALRERRSRFEAPAAAPGGPNEGTSSADVEAAASLSHDPDEFWRPAKALDSFAACPRPPELDLPILRRLGESPFKVGGRDFALLLAEAYQAAGAAALHKAFGTSDQGISGGDRAQPRRTGNRTQKPVTPMGPRR